MAKQHIAEEWQRFQTAVIPSTAPAIQRREMRRAFYAGASSMLAITKDLGREDISEDDAVAVLEKIQDEIRAFLVLVASGGDRHV